MLALHSWNRKPNTFLWTGYFSKSCYKAWCRRAKPSPLPRKNWTLAAVVMTSGGGGEKAGYAIVTSHKHQSLTLTGRLPKRLKESPWAEHRDRNETNIYTDSECAFTVGATHIAIWKARWWLTGRWSSLKHHKEILQWLAAFNLSEKVTVLHWRGHQMHHSSTSERNQKENREAKAMVPTPHPTSLSLLLFNKTLEPLCLWTPNVMCCVAFVEACRYSPVCAHMEAWAGHLGSSSLALRLIALMVPPWSNRSLFGLGWLPSRLSGRIPLSPCPGAEVTGTQSHA